MDMLRHKKGTVDWLFAKAEPANRGLFFFQIDTPGAASSFPTPASAGTAGWFNPIAGGGTGTIVSADWLNSIQAELLNILQAGGVTPSKTAQNQLLTALQTLFPSAQGQCQLQYSSNVQCVLVPMGGQSIKVNGKIYAVPAAGLAIPTTGVQIAGTVGNLAASTVYLVYVKDNGSGVLVPDLFPLAAGTHMTDTTAGNVGVEVRSAGGTPDSTRTLVGMVATDASSHFNDADGLRTVLSWFNRRRKASRTQPSSAPTTSSTTPVELATSIRGSFLVWAGDVVDFSIAGIYTSGATNSEPITSIGFDGTTPDIAVVSAQAYQAGAAGSCAVAGTREGLAEGLHYATVLGSVNATYPFAVTWTALSQTITLIG
jgi:hypothetical protein